MKLFLEIACDNAAFGLDCDDVVNDDCRAEVARILRDAARRIEAGDDISLLMDSNGNRVGSYRLANVKESGL